jgi:hypothetical protein
LTKHIYKLCHAIFICQFGAAVRNLYLFTGIMLIALIGVIGAQSLATGTSNIALSSFLSKYIPTGIIINSTYTNQSLNGNNYVVMQLPQSGGYVVVISYNGNYSLVTNSTTIDSILTPLLTNQYYPNNATINYLNSSMHMYQKYGAANISDCLQETGLNSQTCTLANTCQACQSTPVCKDVFDQVGGPSSPFGLGIINFSNDDNQLNTNYSNYYSVLSKISRANAGTTIAALSRISSNISGIASNLGKNPIFPPPSNTTFAECPAGQSASSQPWYCIAVGFCTTIPFNSSQISGIKNTLNNLQAKLPTAVALSSISFNSSQLSQSYINAALSNQNGAAFAALINSYYPQYNSIINKSDMLLIKYNNVSLNASIGVLQVEFSAIKRLGTNQSINVANTILASLIANSTRIYNSANASYYQVYSISENNSAAILADQLSYQQTPSELAILGNRQAAINIELNSRVNSNQIAAIIPSVQSIRVESAVFVAPITVGYMIKTLDTSFIDALSGSGTPPQKIAMAPVYAALESIIIGILILIIIFLIVYVKVIRKGKAKNKNSKMMWMAVFAVLVVLVALYIYATFAYASNANSNFLPFNYFKNTVKASTNVYIALNGSAATNTSIAACTTTIRDYLSGEGKSVQVIKLTNYSCVSGGNISTLGLDCYGNILSSGDPVILISQSKSSSIVYKGLYGTVLYANGDAATGSSCILGTLFRN